MRKLFILSLFLGLGALPFSCEEAGTDVADIPPAIVTAFENAYPGATDVEWEDEMDGTYEVEFELAGEEFEIEIAADGTITEIEED